MSAENLDTAAASLKGGRLDDVKFQSNRFAFSHPANGAVTIGGLTGTTKAARLDALDDISSAV